MTLLYVESSALFKRYRQEIGTEVLDHLFDDLQPHETILTSMFSSVEITAIARRLLKGRLIRLGYHERILARFADDSVRLISFEPVTEAVLERAREVVRLYALRPAGDALQLATALDVRAVYPQKPFLFSADRELYDAAIAAGLDAVDPEDPDAAARLTTIRRR